MSSVLGSPVNRLRDLCSKHSDGALALSLDKNIARLSLDNHEICHAFYSGHTGMDALTLLRTDLADLARDPKISYFPSKTSRHDNSLPSTHKILGYLAQEPDQNLVMVPQPQVPTNVIVGVPLDESSLPILEQVLTQRMGKLGGSLSHTLRDRTDSLRIAIELLHEYLPNPAVYDAIKQNTRTRLAPLIESGQISTSSVSILTPEMQHRLFDGGALITDEERAIVTGTYQFHAVSLLVLDRPDVKHIANMRNLIDFLFAQLPDQSAEQFRAEVRFMLAAH